MARLKHNAFDDLFSNSDPFADTFHCASYSVSRLEDSSCVYIEKSCLAVTPHKHPINKRPRTRKTGVVDDNQHLLAGIDSYSLIINNVIDGTDNHDDDAIACTNSDLDAASFFSSLAPAKALGKPIAKKPTSKKPASKKPASKKPAAKKAIKKLPSAALKPSRVAALSSESILRTSTPATNKKKSAKPDFGKDSTKYMKKFDLNLSNISNDVEVDDCNLLLVEWRDRRACDSQDIIIYPQNSTEECKSLNEINSSTKSNNNECKNSPKIFQAIEKEITYAHGSSINNDSLNNDSLKNDSVKNDSLKNDSLKTDSIKNDSLKTDSVKNDLVKNDSVIIDLVDIDLGNDDSVNDDSMNNISVNEYSMNDDSENDDSVNNDAVNDDSKNDDSVNDDSVNDDSENDDPVNDDSENDDSENDDPVNDDSENDDPENDDPENNDSENDDSLNNISVNDDSVNDESENDDSVNDDSVSNDSVNNISMNDDPENDDSVNDDSVNNISVNNDNSFNAINISDTNIESCDNASDANMKSGSILLFDSDDNTCVSESESASSSQNDDSAHSDNPYIYINSDSDTASDVSHGDLEQIDTDNVKLEYHVSLTTEISDVEMINTASPNTGSDLNSDDEVVTETDCQSLGNACREIKTSNTDNGRAISPRTNRKSGVEITRKFDAAIDTKVDKRPPRPSSFGGKLNYSVYADMLSLLVENENCSSSEHGDDPHPAISTHHRRRYPEADCAVNVNAKVLTPNHSTLAARRKSRREHSAMINRQSLMATRSFLADNNQDWLSMLLRNCNQETERKFAFILKNKSKFHGLKKVGEGVFGEVFMITRKAKGKPDSKTILKIIPINGDIIVNGENQKTFKEIISEIAITKELSNLRNSTDSSTETFVNLLNITLVKGKFPQILLNAWDKFDQERTSENDRPDNFPSSQHFVIFEFENCGTDLESIVLDSGIQAISIFEQIVCGLSVAEHKLQFEHRDLHWGNILIRKTEEPFVNYILEGKKIEIPSYGVKVSIIDFTLSRLKKDDFVIYLDLGVDETLFTGEGDYQFDIYRLMKKHNRNTWTLFNPFTNCLWLHYILLKLMSSVKYSPQPICRVQLDTLKNFADKVLNYPSSIAILNYLL